MDPSTSAWQMNHVLRMPTLYLSLATCPVHRSVVPPSTRVLPSRFAQRTGREWEMRKNEIRDNDLNISFSVRPTELSGRLFLGARWIVNVCTHVVVLIIWFKHLSNNFRTGPEYSGWTTYTVSCGFTFLLCLAFFCTFSLLRSCYSLLRART
jgi:hypothetical protein